MCQKEAVYNGILNIKMKYLTLIFILLLLVSCGKKRTVHGRIYNPVNNKGIAGVNVYLMKEKICLGYGCDDKVIESTTTEPVTDNEPNLISEDNEISIYPNLSNTPFFL